MDLIADHDGKPRALLARAAPLVGPLVGVLAEELLRQPAVSAVDGYHVEAFVLGVDRRPDVVVDDIIDFFRAVGCDRMSVDRAFGWSLRCTAVPSAMGQLCGCHRAVTFDAVSHPAQIEQVERI